MLRKRRSLIASGGPASPHEPGEEPSEASPAASPAEPPPAEPAAAPSAEAEPSDPWGGAPSEALADAQPSDPFAGQPAAADPFGEQGPADPFGGFDEIHAEVKERPNAAGRHYTDHGSAAGRNDTTDSGWSNSAFGGRDSALPSGWGTPEPAPSRSSSLGAQKPIRSAFGEDEPPTEELPSATFDDRAPAMGAPMNVPEPPPIPGLFDRFTPAPPVARGAGKSFGSGAASPAEPARPRFEATPPPTRPSYLDAEPGVPGVEQSKPLPRTAAKTPAKEEEDDDEEEAAPSGGIPFPVILGGAAVIVGGFLMVLALVVVQMTSGNDTPAPPPAPIVVPVPVARTIVVPPPAPVAADTDAPSMEETTATTAPAAATPAAATTDPVKAPTLPTEPKAVKPKAEPKAATTTAKPTGATGTLKIRSNRRVLIKVNGKPRDYSPLDLPIAPGTYTVSAALAGKPESEQTVTVTLQSSAIEPVNFTF